MQQTQDKALRRVSELKEQCSLEQKAKRHLEEELRADIEEKQHVIEALQTKVSLLKSGGKNVIEDSQNNENLVDVSENSEGLDTSNQLIQRDSDKVATLEGKQFQNSNVPYCRTFALSPGSIPMIRPNFNLLVSLHQW